MGLPGPGKDHFGLHLWFWLCSAATKKRGRSLRLLRLFGLGSSNVSRVSTCFIRVVHKHPLNGWISLVKQKSACGFHAGPIFFGECSQLETLLKQSGVAGKTARNTWFV
jgi:hypothetical protein